MKRGNVNPKFLKNNDEKVASVEKCQRLTGFCKKNKKRNRQKVAPNPAKTQVLKYFWFLLVGLSGSVIPISPASNAGCR